MIKADFHNHSTFSDGSNTIEEITKMAVEKGLDVIAITDHDTLSHRKKIKDTQSLKVICGIEISAFDYDINKRVHILGYNIKNDTMVEKFVHPLLTARDLNSRKQIKVLQNQGYEIDLDRISTSEDGYIYKQHIMKYLVETGQVKDMFGTFYQTVFKHGGICDFDIHYLDPYEAVKVIKEAGGVAVLAHSGQQQNFELIPKLVRAGLDGLEYNHPANSDQDKKIMKEYANRYNLFLTGGSDSHGKNEKNSAGIGTCLSEESGVEAILYK